ncbi:MAG: hypothetical protein H0W83_02235 [Planctomycetes bacterium]|nr:hypothetical protein [Planctomycetota bacterium]
MAPVSIVELAKFSFSIAAIPPCDDAHLRGEIATEMIRVPLPGRAAPHRSEILDRARADARGVLFSGASAVTS